MELSGTSSPQTVLCSAASASLRASRSRTPGTTGSRASTWTSWTCRHRASTHSSGRDLRRLQQPQLLSQQLRVHRLLAEQLLQLPCTCGAVASVVVVHVAVHHHTLTQCAEYLAPGLQLSRTIHLDP